MTIIYVSHKLGEIFSLADRISVIRDGSLVSTDPVAEFDHEKVVHAMLGRQPAEIFPQQIKPRRLELLLLDIQHGRTEFDRS